MLPISSASMTRAVFSGYNQINQIKYLNAMSNRATTDAVSPVKPVTSVLNKENTVFIRDFQNQMTDMLKTAESALNAKPDKLAASSSSEDTAKVSGKLSNSSDRYELTIEQTAAAQVNRSDALVSDGELPTISGSIQLKTSEGNFEFRVNSAGARTNEEALQKIADKVNAAQAGIAASVRTENGKSVLELTGETGAENTFTVTGTAAEKLGLTNVVQQSQDAIFSVNKNDGEEVKNETSKTNSITVDDIEVELAQKGTAVIQAGGNDASSMADAMNKVVDNFNKTLAFLDKNAENRMGVLQQMKRMLIMPTSERSMESIGVSVNKDGTLVFDEDQFMTAMKEDATGTKKIATQLIQDVKQDARDGMNTSSADLVDKTSNQNLLNPLLTSGYANQMDPIKMMNSYNRTGVFNFSNYYAVGLFINTYV